jgi:hypothetical protein
VPTFAWLIMIVPSPLSFVDGIIVLIHLLSPQTG